MPLYAPLVSELLLSMASSSSPNYQVFLSFRGEDTRNTFTDHLYHALRRAGVHTFRDNDEIDRGEELKPEIETAIVKSRASIVVLSENYANSRWCLDELALIMEQRRKCNHFVLPVFYHVDPSDVRNQRGSFAIELKIDDVSRWKQALTDVANLTGMTLSGSRLETEFITEMVDAVQYKLDSKQLSIPAHLTGMESRVEAINSWLKSEQSNAIAICGMGGSGKTTLAQYIYNLNKQDFESSSFVEEIGKHYKHRLLGLQKQLLRDILGGKKIMISSVCEGTQKIEEILQKKKVLIVLDDIDDLDELSTLLGTKAIFRQSKIIITTRLLDINAWFRSISWRCLVHKLKFLNDNESVELLSLHAFGSKIPMEGFKDLAVQLAQYCGGNPLALKVLGSSLFVSDEDPHKRNNIIDLWIDTISSFNSSKGDLHSKIQDVLRKSFDCLQLDSHKELFLDIACFFVGESQDMVTILRDDLNAKSGIMTLINRCLLTVSPDGELMMHQLLQDMARKIIYEKSKDSAKRSRVWLDDESYHVLRKGYGSDTIEGLALNMQNVGQEIGSQMLALKTSSLAKMDKLKLLQLKYVKLSGSYKNFPELRWLCWHGCLLKKMPSGLLMSSLVVIDMSYGHMEMFVVPKVINTLKILKLEGCYKLVSICNLHRLTKLETLMLRNCNRLRHLCKSIGDLQSLANLYLAGCTELLRVSSSRKYVIHPERLKALCIGGATPEKSLFFLPQSLLVLDLDYCDLGYNNDVHLVSRAQSLFNLFLSRNPFEYLPNDIDLKMLHILSLFSCRNLKSLPCMPSTLVELYVDNCKSLKRITFQSGRFNLKQFSYEGCFNLYEVQGLFKLVPIATIEKADLVQQMQWIKEYEEKVVDLAGDENTLGIGWKVQMLYEYGIMSTYLQGIKDQSMPMYQFTSSSSLSFCVPLHEKNHRIQGLHVSCLYKSTRSMRFLLAKISNRTKGLTWIYNPVVYCKPEVDEDVVWLSYWPLGNTLDVGDEVIVNIFNEKGEIIVSRCGASLVYIDDGGVEEEENSENNSMKDEEVIGGDLSEFEVTTGGYYLCRRDLFGLETSTTLKGLFNDNIDYPESQGWRKTHQPCMGSYKLDPSKKIVLKVSCRSEREISKIMKEVTQLVPGGVDSVCADRARGKLIVIGRVNPIQVIKCVCNLASFVEVLSVHTNIRSQPNDS